MNITRPTIMEVNVENFKYNIEQIKKLVGTNTKIMPVIKSNAYGTYINEINDIINKFDIVAVALVDEGVALRKQGYKNEIFILNQPFEDEIDKIVKYDITVGVSSDSFVDKIGELSNTVKVHIEIETGMERTGITLTEVSDYIEKIKKYKNIEIEGIYTHLSSADYDVEYTKKQLELFDTAISIVKEKQINIKYIHALASNGILNFFNKNYNLVRPGIILYGYPSYNKTSEKINLKPVCKLKSKITFLKEISENTSVGYSRSFITNRKTKVATIPIGYADGIRRCYSNKGEVVVKGKKVPVIGNVCMDSFMIDVTNIDNVEIGDEVYIWDNDIITLDNIADLCGTINYEIISTISNRVPRIFI